ncbi:hypothetical protein GOP47_0026022 [Adiantum capillus-veneris]|uniref:Late embryogenesis abundant protein LEA-2 subgroup domain-containing protein n=1 Tax=Adiantum capillus-veneris TaxID=13818 RepID=A0A9D4U2A2_ADICA|nr:hypothetical protein GOP47_0026022 [Adiantum capillus-veneris]
MVELNNVEQAVPAPFHRRRPWTCCCLIFFFLIVLIAIIIVILAFTVFKPKKAEVSVEKVELLNFKSSLGGGLIPTPSINITLAVDLSLHNPNKASFKYSNSTAMVYYYDDEVAVVTIPAGAIGSDATKTMSVTFIMLADQLVTNSHLVNDFLAGSLPFTTRTKISGRVKVLFIKRHVDILSQCSVSISVVNASISNTDCENKVHL